MKLLKSRTTAVLAGAAAIAVMSGGGVAVAGGLIGSGDIKDDSIRSNDLHDGGVRFRDLGDGLQARVIEPGPQGDQGLPGQDGADGASAYELAQAGGFDGTVAEWLASLEGEPGQQGDRGPAVESWTFEFNDVDYSCADADGDLAYECVEVDSTP